ncbi:MAG: DUF1573 domain-containing protein [Bacteroidota bacterium]
MKIKILNIVLFLIFNLPAFSQTEKLTSKMDPSDGPRIAFEETEYDFGTIQSGGNAVHYFVFSSTGKVPLVILNVRTSCGCMVQAWPKTPVGAGMKDSLRVEYNTKVKGAFNKTITVQSNAVNAMVELRIKGNVIKAK